MNFKEVDIDLLSAQTGLAKERILAMFYRLNQLGIDTVEEYLRLMDNEESLESLMRALDAHKN